MKMYDVQAIEIEAAAAVVFRVVSDPERLPEWAEAFEAADHGKASLVTPRGKVEIELRTVANAGAGTVDWTLVFPDGATALAQSRVTGTGRGTTIYSFVLHAPPVPLEEIEGALDVQRRTLARELEKLRELCHREVA